MTDTDPIKRMHYFDHQFLREADFTAEQAYHLRMRRLHNRHLHTWGVANGLELSAASGASRVTISAGMAVDGQGREIVLLTNTNTDDLSSQAARTLYITIAYGEALSDENSETGVSGDTRTTEAPTVELDEDPPARESEKLILGRVKMGEDGRVGGFDDGDEQHRRRAAGVIAGDLEARSLALTDPDVDSSQWPRLRSAEAGQAALQGGLRVSGDLTASGTLRGTLASSMVGTTQLADNAVNAAKIQDGSVGTAELANNAVTEPKLANAAISTRAIASGAVDEARIANNAVSTRVLQDNAVNAAKILDGSVGTAELADNAVNAAKILDGSVGTAELADNAVNTAKILDGSVGTAELANNAVTEPKLANAAISTRAIANGAVDEARIANNAVSTRVIAAGAVDEARLANGSVSIKKFKANLVWDSTTTIAASASAGFNVLSARLSAPRGGHFIVLAYTTTHGGRFEWREDSTTAGPTDDPIINQNVRFQNLVATAIQIKFKIYDVLET